jgi:DedD protein
MSGSAIPDPVNTQIKERLIGAVVLVALGVWLIPWLLDGGDTPSGPAAERDAETVLELPVPNPATSPSASASSAVEEAAAERPESAADRDEAVADRSEPPPERAEVSLSSRDPAPPQAGAPAAAAPTSEARGSSSPAGDWTVQLGSFREPDNARQLASRVAQYGYEATVSEYHAESGVLHRVRVGSFATRRQAEAAGSSLSAHGLTVSVLREE